MRVVVVGGGPAGIAAALRARDLGAKVTLLERERVGGTCFDAGPTPMRRLVHCARLARDSRTWAGTGLHGSGPLVRLREVLEDARTVAGRVHSDKHLAEELTRRGVDVREGIGGARFVDPHTVALSEGPTFHADRIVIATGGHGTRLPIPGADLGLSPHELWHLDELPRRIVVVGGAARGCQLASLFADFGAATTLLESTDRLVCVEDQDVSVALRRSFEARGIRVLTRTRPSRITRERGALCVRLEGGAVLETKAVFFAVGWPGNVGTLDLGASGVAMAGTHIAVDPYLRTSVPHIFAVGDVNGLKMLVQTAAQQGRVAAENAVLGPRRAYSSSIVATTSTTYPEYASVGLTEQDARAVHDCAVATFRYDGLTRAVVDHATDGFCKLVADRATSRLLGAHIVGECAGEVVQIAATCMAAGMSVLEIARMQFAYPTFAQAIGITALRLARELELLPKQEASFAESDSVVER